VAHQVENFEVLLVGSLRHEDLLGDEVGAVGGEPLGLRRERRQAQNALAHVGEREQSAEDAGRAQLEPAFPSASSSLLWNGRDAGGNSDQPTFTYRPQRGA
jgi:hypothetical protein